MTKEQKKELSKLMFRFRYSEGHIAYELWEEKAHSYVERLELEAKAEEMERCCKATCIMCKLGEAVFYNDQDNMWHHHGILSGPCEANAIRRGGGE